MSSADIQISEDIISKYVLEHLTEAKQLIDMALREGSPSKDMLVGDYFVSMALEHFSENNGDKKTEISERES